MPCGGSSALRWTGAWKSVQSVWVCAAGRADGWYFDWKLCYRAGADRVRTGDGYRGYWRHGKKSSGVEEIQEDVLKTSETGNSYQAPGPHPPEPPRPSQPSPHPPELPRPGQPSPHPPKPSRPESSRPLPGIPCDDPFNDGYFTDCRKIRPSDCSALCRKNGCFCSNRFVMYGYQNFGHLLLCRNPRGQYILGVPGGYSQQERFMANMFGFPYFKECPDIHIPGGKGGYWYCFINI